MVSQAKNWRDTGVMFWMEIIAIAAIHPARIMEVSKLVMVLMIKTSGKPQSVIETLWNFASEIIRPSVLVF